MVAEDFITTKHASWERLTQLIRTAQSNIVALQASDLQELGRLYRQATSDLAQARRDYPGHQVTIYLNDLVAQGHNAIYRERSSALNKTKEYFTELLPRTFRQTWPFTLAAFMVFFIPALIGWIIAARDPNQGLALMPDLTGAVHNIQTRTEWWRDLNEANGAGATVILTNNIYVSFQAFVGGLSIGIFTIYALYYNGLMFGVLTGAAHNMDFASNLWNFVIAHGVVELSIIFIAGGAGFQLAWAILRPGLLSRRTALLAASRRAFILSGAIIMFLILAGLIEGFISPSYLPFWFKLAVGLLSGAGMYSYLLLAGRKSGPVAPSDDSSILQIERTE